jgi:hypothetical protein
MAAVSVLVVLAAAHCAAAVERQSPLHAGLLAARVAEPAKAAGVLRQLSLDSSTHWRHDLASLNTDEQARLVHALEQGGVPLGDRSRLRVWVESGVGGNPMDTTHLNGGPDKSGTARALQTNSVDTTIRTPEEDGVSSDTIAIILTGLTAVAGFLLQARQSASAERAQAVLAKDAELAQANFDIEHQVAPHPTHHNFTACTSTCQVAIGSYRVTHTCASSLPDAVDSQFTAAVRSGGKAGCNMWKNTSICPGPAHLQLSHGGHKCLHLPLQIKLRCAMYGRTCMDTSGAN